MTRLRGKEMITRPIQNSIENIDPKGATWVNKVFSHPERTIRVRTSFSGIGAFEYALKRLGLRSEIVFAGDIDANCKTHTLRTIV